MKCRRHRHVGRDHYHYYCQIIQLCSGIIHGIVLIEAIYAQRFQKLIYQTVSRRFLFNHRNKYSLLFSSTLVPCMQLLWEWDWD